MVDPVDQKIEELVITPLSQFLSNTSPMDATHQRHVQRFANTVGSLFTSSEPFSGAMADAVATAVGNYLQSETALTGSGVSPRLTDANGLCEFAIRYIQGSMERHWLPWPGGGSAGNVAQGAFLGAGSISWDVLIGDLGLGLAGAALSEVLLPVGIVVAAAAMEAMQIKFEEIQDVISVLVGLMVGVQSLTATRELALPAHPDALLSAVAVDILNSGLNFAKKPRSDTYNQVEDKQWRWILQQIARRLGRRLTKDEQRRLHDAISKQGYDIEEIIEIGVSMFGP